jgi:hypothetical protein
MIMKRYIGKILAMTFIATLITVGCTDSFEEVNTDPDRAKDAPATNVLAFVLRYHSSTFYDVWNNMSEPSTYGGHLTKIQYIDEARYQFRPGTVENKWYQGYIALNNINEIKKKAEADDTKNLLGVAKVLEAFIFQAMTDTWRDIPYTEAIKMADGILLPKYDKQEDIYPALLATLAEANSLLGSGNDALGVGDLLFNGDVQKWKKFCNSLRLRIAMRISGVNAGLAKSTVETIMGNKAQNPIMESNADNAFFVWPGVNPYEEPWMVDAKTRDDHAISDLLVDHLKALNDPRLPVYAIPAVADGEYRGFTIGAAAQPALPTVSRIGTRFRKDAKGFSPYMRYSETMFYVAEAAMKGYNVGMTAEQAYNKGVEASVLENGLAQAAADAYLAASAKFNNTTDQLYEQLWIALFKQGMEAWSLYRRTGIPKDHYVAPGSPYSGHNSPPFRYPYPQNELTYNGANSTPFVNEVADDFWGKKMWWDTRAGVQ